MFKDKQAREDAESANVEVRRLQERVYTMETSYATDWRVDDVERKLKAKIANLETTLNLLLPVLGLELGDEPEVPAVPARRVIKKVGKK